MADKKKKSSRVVFNLMVKDTFFRKLNYNIFSLLLFIIVAATYTMKFIFFPGMIFVVIMTFVMFKLQKEHNLNLKSWYEDQPDKVEFWVDRENGKIYANGYELNSKDVKWLRFKVKNIPTQNGITGSILKSNFINAYMEFELTTEKIVTVPIQSKSEIRAIINTFTALDVKSSFDITIYKACGLK